jgi:deoxyribonuclease-4
MKASLSDIPLLLREEGLDAFEYEAIYWGRKPQVKREHAEELGLKARENDVLLSMHGSYFVNLCGERKIVEASKRRLIACCSAAHWMGAYVVVFHPGYYSGRSKAETLKTCAKVMGEVVEAVRTLGIRNVKLGPENAGKLSQFGSLDEIISLCETVEQTQLVIDWSHLHARGMGRFRTVEDFREVVVEIENRLGTEAARNMHCHFTKIEFTDKGERRHHTLDEAGYGPDFMLLARVVSDFGLRPVLICESPLLDIDAMRMRDILQAESKRS